MWSALIVAAPGDLRDGLQSLLTTIPGIGPISQANDEPTALRIIEQQSPDLVLLDFHIPGDNVPAVLERIKAEYPQTRSLVLADHVQQQREAKSVAADVVVLKGFLAAKLVETIMGLLPSADDGTGS